MPWWFVPFALVALYWPAVLAAFCIAVLLAVYTQGIARAISACVAGVLLLVGSMVGLSLLVERHHEAVERVRSQAYTARTTETLNAPRLIQRLSLPAGTELDWNNVEHSGLHTAVLPAGTHTVLNLPMTGTIQDSGLDGWTVQLAQNRTIGRWPCHAGEIQLSALGEATKCVLSAPVHFLAQRAAEQPGASPVTLPEGTTFQVSVGSDVGYNFQLPEGKPLVLAEVGATIPSGASVMLFRNGAIREVYSDDKAPLSFGAVTFTADARWIYPDDPKDDSLGPVTAPTFLWGGLSHSVQCGDQRIPAAILTFARVDFHQHTVQFSQSHQDEGETAGRDQQTAWLPITSCTRIPDPPPPSY